MTDPSAEVARHWWPSLLVAAVAAGITLLLFGLQPPGSPRYWWYAAVGEFISTWQAIPDEQLFLHLVDHDTPWIYRSWLGAVTFGVFDQVGGIGLAMLVRNLAAALAVGLFGWVLARGFDEMVSVGVSSVVLAVALAATVPVEPWSLTVPLTVLATLAAYATCERPERWWRAAALPLVVLAIVNVDAAAALAVALLGAAVAAVLVTRLRADDTRPTSIAAAVVAAAALPALLGFAYGPGHWADAPAALFDLPDRLWSARLLVPTLGAAIALGALTRLGDRVVVMSRTAVAALVVATAALAVVSPPALPIFATVATLVVAATLDETADGPATPSGWVLAAILAGVVALGVVLQPGVDTRTPIVDAIYDDVRTDPPHPGLMAERTPLRCAEELRDARGDLRLFHHPDDAGLLLYHLLDTELPRAMLFDDHRNLLDDQIRQHAAIIADDGGARGRFNQHDINAAILDRDDYTEAVDELQEAPGWYDLRPGDDQPYGCFIDVEPVGDRD